jgi:hypothetical protein
MGREAEGSDHARDRDLFPDAPGEACGKTGWRVHAYCLMPNHYGEERFESDEEKALPIVGAELKGRGWTEHELQTRTKGDKSKVEMAARLRQETTMTLDRGTAGDGKLDERSEPSCLKTESQTMSRFPRVHKVGDPFPSKSSSTFIALACLMFVASPCSRAQSNASGPPPPPAGFASRLDYVKSFTNEDEVTKAYHQSLISKDEAMMAHLLIGNLKRQDFYGKVVDQHGQPVAGANVTGYLRSDEGFGINDEKVEEYSTTTDADGLFEFTGLHGARFGEKVSKAGYDLESEGYVRQTGAKTNPNDRATFMMWRLRGAEPLIHNKFQSRVPYDGASAGFNLATGKKDASGDLRFTLSRFPLKIHRGRDKYYWTLKIEMTRGGLLGENDPYPYLAPEAGYVNVFQSEMKSNSVPWSGDLRQNFYIRMSDGQYGRLFVDLSTDSMRPDTGVTIETWVNPSGSRNLEFDPKKQIRP